MELAGALEMIVLLRNMHDELINVDGRVCVVFGRIKIPS